MALTSLGASSGPPTTDPFVGRWAPQPVAAAAYRIVAPTVGLPSPDPSDCGKNSRWSGTARVHPRAHALTFEVTAVLHSAGGCSILSTPEVSGVVDAGGRLIPNAALLQRPDEPERLWVPTGGMVTFTLRVFGACDLIAGGWVDVLLGDAATPGIVMPTVAVRVPRVYDTSTCPPAAEDDQVALFASTARLA